jgi:hypothetical protein
MPSDWYDFKRTGRIMCCICFGGFTLDELQPDKDYGVTDVCKQCWVEDQELLRRKESGELQ